MHQAMDNSRRRDEDSDAEPVSQVGNPRKGKQTKNLREGERHVCVILAGQVRLRWVEMRDSECLAAIVEHVIFLFSLVGQPAFYFAVELVAFNVILVILMFAEAQLEKKLSCEARVLIGPRG